MCEQMFVGGNGQHSSVTTGYHLVWHQKPLFSKGIKPMTLFILQHEEKDPDF